LRAKSPAAGGLRAEPPAAGRYPVEVWPPAAGRYPVEVWPPAAILWGSDPQPLKKIYNFEVKL